MKQTFEVSQLHDAMLQHGFTNIKLYAQNGDLRCIETITKYYRKPFFIMVPNTITIKIDSRDVSVTEYQNDYTNKLQRDFLDHLPIDGVLCKSNKNITLKHNKTYSHFLIECDTDSESESSHSSECSESLSVSSTDTIEIEEYPVDNVMAYWFLPVFMDNISTFETTFVLPVYHKIFTWEEMWNEKRVEHLLHTFDIQKNILKQKITNIHEKIYNIHHDIEAHSKKLERLYILQHQSTHEKDRKRYKINRLILEVQATMDELHEDMKRQRILSDRLIHHYLNYTSRFNK